MLQNQMCMMNLINLLFNTHNKLLFNTEGLACFALIVIIPKNYSRAIVLCLLSNTTLACKHFENQEKWVYRIQSAQYC